MLSNTERQLTPGARIVVASHNTGKVREFADLFEPYGLDIVSAADLQLPEAEETETTFEGNARIKALAAASASGLLALADDSGLEVACLGGAPGVHSARWAGPGKDFSSAMQRVRDEVVARGGFSDADRCRPVADFRAVLCLAWPDEVTRVFEGRIDGVLVWPPRGGKGFGYDRMFEPDGAAATFGEMEPAAKHAVSHRARAFAAFIRDMLPGHAR